MSEKELFEIAIKYVVKEYSHDDLKWEDDLYSATKEDKDACVTYYCVIKDNGLIWAYSHLKTLEDDN